LNKKKSVDLLRFYLSQNSGSMEPAFHRGDLLFLTLPRNDPVEINDICVFKLPGRPIPIVHRVVKVHEE
jgi:signal peptidase